MAKGQRYQAGQYTQNLYYGGQMITEHLHNLFIEGHNREHKGHNREHIDSSGETDTEERDSCPFCALACILHSRSSTVLSILRERDSQGRYTGWPEAAVYAESLSWCLKTAAPGLIRHNPELAQRIIDANLSPAASLGRKGGQATTPAKTEASRTNGKKGGRPARDSSAFD
jgi:hypothetical protein